MALQDGFAKHDLLVAFFKCGESTRGCEVAGGDVVIEGSETHLKGIRKAFRMASWISGEGRGLSAHVCWIFD